MSVPGKVRRYRCEEVTLSAKAKYQLLLVLDLLLKIIPKLLAHLWVIDLLSAATQACPRDEELQSETQVVSGMDQYKIRHTYFAVVLDHIGHGARPELCECTVRSGIAHAVLDKQFTTGKIQDRKCAYSDELFYAACIPLQVSL